MLKTPLGAWTNDHSTNGIWTFYEMEEKVYEYVTPAIPATATNDIDDRKYWNVYVKHGSTLIHSSQCSYEELNRTHATPIHITKLSNSKLVFSKTS